MYNLSYVFLLQFQPKLSCGSYCPLCGNWPSIIAIIGSFFTPVRLFEKNNVRVVIDGRNALDPLKLPQSIIYRGIGKAH